MTIDEAFKSKNFTFLRDWYLTNGSSFILKTLIKGDLDEYTKSRLLSEIEKILPPEVPNDSVGSRMLSKPPAVLKRYNEARNFFKLMKEARILLFSEDHEIRKKAALDIVKYQKLNRQAWADIDHFDKFGYIPSEIELNAQIDALSVWDSVQQYILDKNYIYKHSKRISKLTGDKKTKLESEIKQRTIRRDLIEHKLKSYESR